MALDKKTKKFIKNKVKKLGGRKEVKILYRKDDLVCKFANSYARKIYGMKKRKKK